MNINKGEIYSAEIAKLKPSQRKALVELREWYKSSSLEHTLKGFAGTGKTYLITAFINSVVDRSYCVTAPTHKALTVVEKQLNVKGKTLHSLHGLKPNVELSTFDINNLEYDTIGVPKLGNYHLLIIDESSMINSSLFELNRRRAKEYGIKVLYIGDPYQLPPVKENESRIFRDVDGVTELDTVLRQDSDNPLLTVFDMLRYDIDNRTSTTLSYLSANKKNIKNDVGYELLDIQSYKTKLLEYFNNESFFNNLDYVRNTAYTNAITNDWNTYIRNNIFTTNGSPIIIHDLLTSYKTLVDDNNNPIITNSEDYIIDDIRFHINEYKLKTICVVLKNSSNLKNTEMLQILNHNDINSLNRYIHILETLRNKALTTHGKGKWYPYYKFKNKILSLIDINVDGIKLTRDIDYGYTLTTHKLQGSTFDNIFVDGFDICNPINKYGRYTPNDINLRNRLLYVALSRAKYKAFIRF